MNWSNVRLILCREIRDQLRDRRTLFMIAVLPLLLYPLLGMSMFQVAQFIREQPTRVLVLGREALPASPTLIEDDHFAERLFSHDNKLRLLELHFDKPPGPPPSQNDGKTPPVADLARRAVEQGEYEAVVYVPPDFGTRLDAFRETLRGQADNVRPKTTPAIFDTKKVPSPEIFYNTAREKSQLAFIRVSRVLHEWTEEIGRQNLVTSRLPPSAVKPFELAEYDVANDQQREAALWSKILPFLMLVWALTGAFYPAVDLCAGEKERGTLETLLSSPAERIEIVWGKLLTVMLFSFATAVLNLMSMGVTGVFVMRQFPELGAPPPLAPLWLLIALVPMSAMFGALCLALAAFARSSKEGQYYLMPLVLVTLPLVVLPMAPGVELNLGNSLVPVTGVLLLLRTVLEGEYLRALPFVGAVAGVTLACCLFAIRWAVDQFNSESVLFRESERLDMGLWFKHLVRDRENTPSVSGAVFCGVLILLVRFFMGFALPQPNSAQDMAMLTIVTELVVIATPSLLMTIMLTRSPSATLLIRRPPLAAVPLAILLAVCVHPLMHLLSSLVHALYPVNQEIRDALQTMVAKGELGLWPLIFSMALVPALFEELAFRGFILSGFRHLGHKWRAIALSAFFFGITHTLFQQSIIACLLGLLIGWIAVQTGSLWPGMAYHAVHNGLLLAISRLDAQTVKDYPQLGWLVEFSEDGFAIQTPIVIVGALIAAGLIYWFHRLPYPKTNEEALQEALEHQMAHGSAGYSS